MKKGQRKLPTIAELKTYSVHRLKQFHKIVGEVIEYRERNPRSKEQILEDLGQYILERKDESKTSSS